MATRIKLIDTGLSPTLAGGTFTGHIDLGDNNKVRFGDSDDYQIHHNANGVTYVAGSVVEHNSSTWRVKNLAGTETLINASADNAVDLYYNGSKKLETTITGVLVTGELESTTLDVNGAGDISGNLAVGGNLTLTGNLSVNGTTTTLSTATLDVEDKNITLNKGSGDTSASADGAGITIQDAVDASNDASLTWNAANDQFVFSHKLVAPRFIQSQNIENTFYSAAFSRSGSGTSADIYGTNGTFALGTDASNTKLVLVSGGVTVTGNTQSTSFTAGTANPNSELLYLLGSGHTGHGASNTGSLVSIVESTSGNLAGLWLGSMTNENTGVIGSRTASGNIAFQTYNGGAWGERMRIKSDGNVGIGTQNPDHTLHVLSGSASMAEFASSNASPFINFARSGARTAYIQLHEPGASGTSQLRFGTGSGHSPTTTMTIDENNRVGIGINAPDGQLHVKGATNKTIKIDGTHSSGEYTALAFARNGTDKWRVFQKADDSRLSFYNDVLGAHQFTLKSTGLVGIGESAPDTQLHVKGSNNSAGDLYTAVGPGNVPSITIQNAGTTNNNNAALFFKDNDGHVASVSARFVSHTGGDEKAQLRFSVTGAGNTREKMVLTEDGHLGINTSSPNVMLHVDRNIASSSTDSISVANRGVTTVNHTTGMRFQFNTAVSAAIRSKLTNTSSGAGTLSFYTSPDGTAGNLDEKMTVLHTPASRSEVHTKGAHAVGDGNTGEVNVAGCRVLGWYNANAHSSNSYLHLVTTLWGGGSPHGNSQYIMGGWEITGHQYSTNASFGKCGVFFHNWSGSVGSGYSINYTGSYQNFAHVYVNSSGYVTVRLNAGSYKGYWLDLFQAGHYPIRNMAVSAATFSNSATL